MKFTLWHLLHAISFTAPLAGAVDVGWKVNLISLVVSLVLGLAIGFCSFVGLHKVGQWTYQRISRLKPSVAQEIAATLLCMGAVAWSCAACGVAILVVKSFVSLLSQQVITP